ncbi:MAG: hypothetical protein HS108_04720 [Planctomycetes bacterium]|jgi:small-conductance mechanosensitive channel|nr:hypothetical protein [Planctomycetota bacterium]MCL4730647.1 hypothetical protein [Planctomycetota bacterium]
MADIVETIVRGSVIGLGVAAGIWIGRAWQTARGRKAAAGPQAAPDIAELDATRQAQAEVLQELKARIAAVQAQRDKALAERGRLLEGLGAIGARGDAGVTIALASAQELADKARELGRHESELGVHDQELGQLQGELQAAEELLAEVDAQRDALKQQVQEQGRELYRLRAEIEATQRRSHEQRARTMLLTRSNVRKTEVVANRLEDQLKHWVKNTGALNVNWSQHGHAEIVSDFFAKLDREFLDRYFSHATNPEYSRGQRRNIRVRAGEGDWGELLITLDDDAGRTLGLRFELKKESPGAQCVGFVLAMYLRALSRDLRDYTVTA